MTMAHPVNLSPLLTFGHITAKKYLKEADRQRENCATKTTTFYYQLLTNDTATN